MQFDLGKVEAALKRAAEVAVSGTREQRSGAILGDAKKRMVAALALTQKNGVQRRK